MVLVLLTRSNVGLVQNSRANNVRANNVRFLKYKTIMVPCLTKHNY